MARRTGVPVRDRHVTESGTRSDRFLTRGKAGGRACVRCGECNGLAPSSANHDRFGMVPSGLEHAK